MKTCDQDSHNKVDSIQFSYNLSPREKLNVVITHIIQVFSKTSRKDLW